MPITTIMGYIKHNMICSFFYQPRHLAMGVTSPGNNPLLN